MKFNKEELERVVQEVEKWSKEYFTNAIEVTVKYDDIMVMPHLFIDSIKICDLHITDSGMDDVDNFIEYIEYEIRTAVKNIIHEFFYKEQL